MAGALLRKCNPRRNASRLTWFDVRKIRLWVRSEGFGLDTQDQVRALLALYDGVKPSTMREVVLGETWADPAYDRTIPLPTANRAPGGNMIMLFVLMMFLAFRNRSCLVTVLPGIFPGYYDVAE